MYPVEVSPAKAVLVFSHNIQPKAGQSESGKGSRQNLAYDPTD